MRIKLWRTTNFLVLVLGKPMTGSPVKEASLLSSSKRVLSWPSSRQLYTQGKPFLFQDKEPSFDSAKSLNRGHQRIFFHLQLYMCFSCSDCSPLPVFSHCDMHRHTHVKATCVCKPQTAWCWSSSCEATHVCKAVSLKATER